MYFRSNRIELRDWTTTAPTERGWYGFRPSDDDARFSYPNGWTMVLVGVHIMDSSVLVACVEKDGRRTGLWVIETVGDLGGQWCGPFVMGE